MTSHPIFDYPLFALGFRAFFALAGLAALILILFWNALFNGSLTTEHYFT
ncbi:MAG: NnrS family protein, partial [Methylobacter sp.]|nr:NnrS family protein [Methylobacter sp.]